MGRTVRPARAGETARTPSIWAAADDGAGPQASAHGIAWLGGEHRQLDVLIAEHSGAAIDRAGVPAGAREGGRGAGDEDTASLMPARPPLDVEGAAAPPRAGARLRTAQRVRHEGFSRSSAEPFVFLGLVSR